MPNTLFAYGNDQQINDRAYACIEIPVIPYASAGSFIRIDK